MRAINGVLEDGRFIPHVVTQLPQRVSAILVYSDASDDVDLVLDNAADRETENGRISLLRAFHEAVREAADEELPDFPRANISRELVTMTDAG